MIPVHGYSLQLVLCAIPAFFKVPGTESSDLGGRTEGRHFIIVPKGETKH